MESKINNLPELYDKANNIILSSNDGDTMLLSNLIQNYIGNDWKQYISSNQILQNNGYNTYNKKLIFGSEILDMVIITWPVQSKSKIHDHPDYGCIAKLLYGELVEDEYVYVSESPVHINTNFLKVKDNKFSFKKGKEILHKISNNSNDMAVSLHFYSKGGYKMNIYENF